MTVVHLLTKKISPVCETEKRRETREIYARLSLLLKNYRSDLYKDPEPYLRRAGDEICRLRKALEDAYAALHPPIQSMISKEPLRPPSLGVEEFTRNRAASTILAEALFNK